MIPREERFLERNFKAQYSSYKARARRWSLNGFRTTALRGSIPIHHRAKVDSHPHLQAIAF